VKTAIASPMGRCFLCVVSLMLLAGCGSSSNRAELEGTVTLDGEPLESGNIQFLPMPGTGGPSAGGKITDGSFMIPSENGTFAGLMRVEMTSGRKTGRKIENPYARGHFEDEIVQHLPTRYNRESELTAEVVDSGPNRFEFSLTSR